MTTQEALLTKLIEECSEVIKRATKIQRFGLLEVQEGKTVTNKYRLENEILDLLTIIDRLKQPDFGLFSNRTFEEIVKLVEDSMLKTERFMEYSRKQGTLQDLQEIR